MNNSKQRNLILNIINNCTKHPTAYDIHKEALKTFPNIKLTGKDGNIIFVKDILKDIQPYYIKVFTPMNFRDVP